MLLCPPPPVIAHATLSAEPGTNFTSGTSVSYSCQPGFSLLGDPSVLCTAWGNWSLPYPRCAGGAGSASTPCWAQHPPRAGLSIHPVPGSAPIPCQAHHTSRAGLSIHPVPGSPYIQCRAQHPSRARLTLDQANLPACRIALYGGNHTQELCSLWRHWELAGGIAQVSQKEAGLGVLNTEIKDFCALQPKDV